MQDHPYAPLVALRLDTLSPRAFFVQLTVVRSLATSLVADRPFSVLRLPTFPPQKQANDRLNPPLNPKQGAHGASRRRARREAGRGAAHARHAPRVLLGEVPRPWRPAVQHTGGQDDQARGEPGVQRPTGLRALRSQPRGEGTGAPGAGIDRLRGDGQRQGHAQAELRGRAVRHGRAAGRTPRAHAGKINGRAALPYAAAAPGAPPAAAALLCFLAGPMGPPRPKTTSATAIWRSTRRS